MKNQIGVITPLPAEGPILHDVSDFELKACQLCCWNPVLYTDERANTLIRELRQTRMNVTSLWAGWPGPATWNFTEGPATLGVVPRKYRTIRVAALNYRGAYIIEREISGEQQRKDIRATLRDLEKWIAQS